MRLYVDLGHTRVKWLARQDTGEALSAATPLGSLAVLPEQWAPLSPPSEVVIASVAPTGVESDIEQAVRTVWSAPIRWLRTPAVGWGVTNGYQAPELLGIDRFAALVAAHARFPEGAVVCDAGTATTIDALVAGEHRGGVILPGIRTQLESLGASVGLEAGPAALPSERLGRSTAAGLSLGPAYALLGACCMVQSQDPALARLPVIVTGGDAEALAAHLPSSWTHDAQLVLAGIEIMARRNRDG